MRSAISGTARAGLGVALRCDGVGLVIGGATILADITCEIGGGEFIGIIGPNGAGKTSLLNVISGTMRHTSGRVYFDGRDISSWPIHERARAGIGRTFQSSYLLDSLTVMENVRLALQARHVGWRGALRLVRSTDRTHAACMAILERVGLDGQAERLATNLSHGEKRKLELAMVLAAEASLILLDEPMAGVNADDVEPLMQVIREVHRTSNATIVMVEHHMEVVLGLAERVAVLHHGALLAFAEPDEVMRDPQVQAAYLGDPL